MPDLIPAPSPDDRPFAETASVDLASGEEITLTYEPVSNDAMFRVGTVAISKRADTEYVLRMDDEVVFGPAPVPPTDVDDLQVTFTPALGFSHSMEVVVRNLSATTGDREYAIQPVGYEVMR
ncbi:hypothetical protein [Halobacterium jilantaiense]|uniref:Uncharacterized protein n=1 Tax=Halobacterium jilantaiense TaxID=355548 RepID=A0A1I0P7A2_9EURY|nr:hypothetical protein [Halobacterium jilantaiense]SEW10124.1 hypothetical protein SAMN04487945_1452 [Halobacterium jilantaiense]